MIETLAAISGVLQSVLAMFNRRCNWLFYILQSLLLAAFSSSAKLYGNALLGLGFALLGVKGWLDWSRPVAGKITAARKAELPSLLLYSGLLLILVAAYVLALPGEFKAFDILTVWTAVLAALAMSRRRLETWPLWLLNDVLYILLYCRLEEKPVRLLALYVFWTGMAAGSWLLWRREYMKETGNCRKTGNCSQAVS